MKNSKSVYVIAFAFALLLCIDFERTKLRVIIICFIIVILLILFFGKKAKKSLNSSFWQDKGAKM